MRIFKFFWILILILGGVYLIGPRVENPDLNMTPVEVPKEINTLKNWISNKEKMLGNVRRGNESYIEFNDSIPKKTNYSVLYLHGFTASGIEGDPVHRKIAKFLNANLYVPRLYGHGLNEKEPMLNYNNNDFWESAKEAISVAKALGDKVILLGPGNSLGGATAQIIIKNNWNFIESKKSFLLNQKKDPFLISMGILEQRDIVSL